MQKLFVIGLAVCRFGAIAPTAIASEATTPPRSMTDLSLPALHSPLPERPKASGQTVSQILPLSNFPDVSPNHWAYSAVNNLAADYGCLAGYPDGTFRGDEFVTRYEFAAALDACLDALLPLTDQQQQANVDQILNDLEALNRELGTLAEDVEETESEISPE